MGNVDDKTLPGKTRIYDGEGDQLMVHADVQDKITLLPDTGTAQAAPGLASARAKLRILWGQNLVEDILAGRYRTLVCSVNPIDNTHGVIAQIAHLLPTSQWDEPSVTAHAKRFAQQGVVTVIKYDMDAVEVLALLRPGKTETLRLDDLKEGFRIVAQMIRGKPQRRPTASVSFLGARANKLRDAAGHEPSFETVLRTMHEAGYEGDVYPAPWMWQASPTGVYARYPFPSSLNSMREGGF
jgi:hypothetical protein